MGSSHRRLCRRRLVVALVLLLFLGSSSAFHTPRSFPRRRLHDTTSLSAANGNSDTNDTNDTTNDSIREPSDDNRGGNDNDPRTFQKNMREQQLQAVVQRDQRGPSNKNNNTKKNARLLIQKRRDGLAASAAMDLPNQPLVKTLPGGTNLIFQMARQMARATETPNGMDPPPPSAVASATTDVPVSDGSVQTSTTDAATAAYTPRAVPGAWPNQTTPPFRTDRPVMNARGYAATIWRNARKRHQPALWRHALRTFDRMVEQSQQPAHAQGSRWSPKIPPRLVLTNIHYEGAMVAAAKLGRSDRALELYHHVESMEQQQHRAHANAASATTVTTTAATGSSSAATSRPPRPPSSRTLRVTENMVLLLVRACVRDATKSGLRAPLDAAVAALSRIEKDNHALTAGMDQSRNGDTNNENQATANHQDNDDSIVPVTTRRIRPTGTTATSSLTTTAVHWNPLARAYQSLGLTAEADGLIRDRLKDRMGGPEAENALDNSFNVYDVQAKDKGSYSLLVSSSLRENDWGGAVDALREMTDAGLYPSSRHLNAWNEI